jgi:hypothetical protein
MKTLNTISVAAARRAMWREFKNDPDFKQTYIDNMACLLMDTLGIMDYKQRNDAARRIIEHMYKEE